MACKTIYQGFTLIEVLIATILVGFAIAALVGANGSFTLANGAGTDMSTAEFLVEQIRELTAVLPVVDPAVTTWTTLGPETGEATVSAYNEVDDFDGLNTLTLGGPISATKQVLSTEFPTFSQQVTVDKVNPSNLDQVEADNYDSDFVRVTVRVLHSGQQVVSASWIRATY